MVPPLRPFDRRSHQLTAVLFDTFDIITFSSAQLVSLGLPSILRRDGQPDSQTIAAREQTCSLFSFFDYNNLEKASAPCKKYCKDVEHKGRAVGVRKSPRALKQLFQCETHSDEAR